MTGDILACCSSEVQVRLISRVRLGVGAANCLLAACGDFLEMVASKRCLLAACGGDDLPVLQLCD